MPELLPYLEAAAAHPDLKRELIEFLQGGSATRLQLNGYAPRVKVERVLTQRFAFTWCCAWRARELGWKDCFGFWDQTRAAREYDWRCFERWETLPA